MRFNGRSGGTAQALAQGRIFQQPADRAGKRLLAIRVDSYAATRGTIAVTLVNAGGNPDGAFRECTLHFGARETDKGPLVELASP